MKRKNNNLSKCGECGASVSGAKSASIRTLCRKCLVKDFKQRPLKKYVS